MHLTYVIIAVVVLKYLQWVAPAAAVFAIAAEDVARTLAAVGALDGSAVIANGHRAHSKLRLLGAV